MKYLATIIALVFLKSCGASQNVANEANETMANLTLSGTYKVDMLVEDSISEELTLEFDQSTNKVSGYSGCNRFFGTYETEGNTITFSEMASTRKLCDETTNATEQKMLATLANLNRFQLKDNQLMLQKDDAVLLEATQDNTSESRQELQTKIVYEATTRGFFEKIWIENNILSYTNDRNLEDVTTHRISDKQIEALLKALNTVEARSLPSFEAPSKRFQFDGAAMATLQLDSGESSYKSQVFDHGNPPKGLDELVNKVLSIKKSMEKQ